MEYRRLLATVVCVGVVLVSTLGSRSAEAEHVVLVQPIVLCDDEGGGPAPMRLREAAVDRAYRRAGVDFCFAEPLAWNNTEARDGLINLDRIVELAREEGVLKGQGEILNMFFVRAVDGREGPLGRGQQGGSIVFIALAEEARPEMEGFVLAHEAGHCLGLIHAVDDPAVSDDLVNLMGDGPFAERTAPEGLTDSQVQTVRASQLVRPRTWYLNREEAKRAILDETYEPFFSRLQRGEIEAFTQQRQREESLEAMRASARAIFQEAVLEFSADEQAMLDAFIAALGERAGDYPLLTEQPWWFIKVRSDHCGGFAHTRGPYLIFSARHLGAMTEAFARGEDSRRWQALLAHEQMHVLQRLYPSRFASLYTEVFGFRHTSVPDHPDLVVRQLSNPDGLSGEWIVPLTGAAGEISYWWPRTLLRLTGEVPVMGRDFEGVAVGLQREGAGFTVRLDEAGEPVLAPLAQLAPFLDRFRIRSGKDHPNEIAAYLIARLVEEGAASGAGSADPMLEAFARWCLENLGRE